MTYDPSLSKGRQPLQRLLRKKQQTAPVEHAHGHRRAGDQGEHPAARLSARRRANGTPLLLVTVLAILSAVGLTRVRARIQVLELAEEITALTESQETLLDRKRRLETERAYLRRPARIRKQALELGMVHVPPEHIQRIRLLEAEEQVP